MAWCDLKNIHYASRGLATELDVRKKEKMMQVRVVFFLRGIRAFEEVENDWKSLHFFY